jgi:phage terminase large subunit
MQFQATTALKKIRRLDKRLKVIQGGSSAGKTIAILLILIDRLQREKGLISSVVSETMPHLKRGAIRDFLNIMEAQGYYKDDRWNRSDFVYTFETGSRLEFFSADSPDKVRGPRRNGDLFINECNNVSFETYTQLAIRTLGSIYLDYNPVSEFWVHDDIIKKEVAHDFLIVTYLDNEGLPQVIVDEIESRRGNKNFWRVYGEGQLGEAEGRIYTGWNIIDEVPHEARLERYGLNFGYSLHPAAAAGIYTYNSGFIIDEVLYGLGLKNRQIADIFKNVPSALICADSAEPKSIDDLKEHGLHVLGVSKGKDSVRHGILYVQDQRISITKRSVNIIKEYRNYLWERDKEGRIVLEPQEPFHYSMDAVRYGIVGVQPISTAEEIRRARSLMHNQQERLSTARSDAGL